MKHIKRIAAAVLDVRTIEEHHFDYVAESILKCCQK